MKYKSEEQSPWTGIAGAGVFLVLMILKPLISFKGALSAISEENYLLLALILQMTVMCLLEISINKVYQKHFCFSRNFSLNFNSWKNIFARWFTLLFILALAGMTYALFAGSRLNSPLLFQYFCMMITGFAVLGLPYLYCYERFCVCKHPDELLSLFRLLTHPRSFSVKELRQDGHMAIFFRFLLVKCFFIPVMVSFLIFNVQAFENYFTHACRFLVDTDWHIADRQAWNFAVHTCYGVLLYLIFLMDLSLAVTGYSLSCKFLDNHAHSTDPSFLGWTVALACYWPFQPLVNKCLYFHLPETSVYFSDKPALSAVMATATLLLFSVYLLATCMFGLRFSNLTHRGIISAGPYAVIRHPAYAAKSLALWIICLPTILHWWQTDVKRCALGLLALIVWAFIYVMRAYTEEWHLSGDERYLSYRSKVRWMFVPCLW